MLSQQRKAAQLRMYYLLMALAAVNVRHTIDISLVHISILVPGLCQSQLRLAKAYQLYIPLGSEFWPGNNIPIWVARCPEPPQWSTACYQKGEPCSLTAGLLY